MDALKLFDVVALLKDRPEEGLVRGQVGTILEEYAPGVFDVEFSDTKGRTYAMVILNAGELMRLSHERTQAA
jgi:hypothetical protein